MKIEVVKKIDYKGCPIYIRKIGKLFEFLVFYNNELYSQYVDISPVWWRKFLKEKYTREQLDNIVKLLLISAQKTIDELRKKKAKIK